MIKVAFFDVDGTLLPLGQDKVPESTRRSINKLREKGIKVVVSTGRNIKELQKLPIFQLDFDGFLTLNGQLCMDQELQVIAGTPIDPEETKILLGIFKAKKIPFLLINEHNRYINYVDDIVVDTQNNTNGTIPEIGEYHGEKIYQVVSFVTPHQRELLTDLLDECAITSWNETGIDIIARGGGKAKGIEEYLKVHGMKAEEAIAFGDGENDIGMLQYVGIGVAMGNAGDNVKAVADYVTDDSDKDGIEKALIHFGII